MFYFRMREEKILISRDGPDSNVLKFKPPMVFSSQDADRLIDTLDRVLAELDDTRVASVTNIKLEVSLHTQSVHNRGPEIGTV